MSLVYNVYRILFSKTIGVTLTPYLGKAISIEKDWNDKSFPQCQHFRVFYCIQLPKSSWLIFMRTEWERPGQIYNCNKIHRHFAAPKGCGEDTQVIKKR
jgi:hypothetical protein